MKSLTFQRRARFTLWLAAIALLFAAVSPALNAARAHAQPQLFAELCTQYGFTKVPLAPDKAPAKSGFHAPECSLCLPADTWLGFAPTDALPVSIGDARHANPLFAATAAPVSPVHTLAWSRAPPVFS